MIRHNKKRNTGLVYEFFSRFIGSAIVEGRDTDIARGRVLLKKHFNKGTDLYKELKLFNTLFESKVSNRDMALHLINRVRESVKFQSQSRLDLEKTSLIHEINTVLKDNSFFDRNVSEYKTYATIQMLLNAWRSSELQEGIGDIVQLEERLIEHLTSKPIIEENKEANITNEDIDHLVINIMLEKVNKKFGDSLTEIQKKLIQLYVFNDKDPNELTSLLESIRDQSLTSIQNCKKEFIKDKFMIEKFEQVSNMLKEYHDVSNISDEMISFYLGISNLEKEFNSND